METTYLSQDKYDELSDELNHLKMVERKQVAEQLEYAKSLGDLSENAEYNEARDKQADIEDRIGQIENILKTAKIISASKNKDNVNVGSVVVLSKKGGSNQEYTIVGSEEASIMDNKISHLSPLGSAVMNKKKGDKVMVSTPKGEVEYTIIEIK